MYAISEFILLLAEIKAPRALLQYYLKLLFLGVSRLYVHPTMDLLSEENKTRLTFHSGSGITVKRTYALEMYARTRAVSFPPLTVAQSASRREEGKKKVFSSQRDEEFDLCRIRRTGTFVYLGAGEQKKKETVRRESSNFSHSWSKELEDKGPTSFRLFWQCL